MDQFKEEFDYEIDPYLMHSINSVPTDRIHKIDPAIEESVDEVLKRNSATDPLPGPVGGQEDDAETEDWFAGE